MNTSNLPTWKKTIYIYITFTIPSCLVGYHMVNLHHQPLHAIINLTNQWSKMCSSSKLVEVRGSVHEYRYSGNPGLKKIHPWNLTWNLKRSPWKRTFLLETIIFRFHVNLQRCTPPKLNGRWFTWNAIGFTFPVSSRSGISTGFHGLNISGEAAVKLQGVDFPQSARNRSDTLPFVSKNAWIWRSFFNALKKGEHTHLKF